MQKLIALVQVILLGFITGCNKKQYNMDIINKFESREFVNAKIQQDSLPYRLYIPEGYNKMNEYPLILYLHLM